MKKYKLSEFGLNKQSLKRKLKNITNIKYNKMLENILNKRTTMFDLDTIEELVEGFYSGVGVLNSEKSTQPLSVYYDKQNKVKYNNLVSLISIKRYDSIDKALEIDVKKIVNESQEKLVDYEIYKTILSKIADKYGVLETEVNKVANSLEDEWIKKLIL